MVFIEVGLLLAGTSEAADVLLTRSQQAATLRTPEMLDALSLIIRSFDADEDLVDEFSGSGNIAGVIVEVAALLAAASAVANILHQIVALWLAGIDISAVVD